MFRTRLRFRNGQSSGANGAFVAAGFYAPLTTSLNLAKGSGSATFTRASVATVMGYAPTANLADGQTLLTVASGEARFAGARRISANNWSATFADGSAIPEATLLGYLSEAAATQLTLDPRDMTTVNWVKVTMTNAKTSVGADGVASAATRLTAAGANSTILQTLVAAATSRTYSCYVKRVTGTGTILLKQGTATLDITALINSSTYTLVQLPDNELNVAYGIQINTSGDAIDVDFNQFEAGAFATSPIPAAGTRNADVLTYSSSGNVLAATGTVYAETFITLASTVIYGRIISMNGAAGSIPCAVRNTGTTNLQVYDGTAWRPGPVFTVGALQKLAVGWGSTLNATVNGSLSSGITFDGVMDLSTTPNNLIGIGVDVNGASNTALSGTIKNVRIWGVQLPNATLQAITQ